MLDSPVPVLLVTGFLGAGKTTLVNALLQEAAGHRRLAAVVNDFGAVNIDAELLAGADGVVSLPGGCLCCALEGDLLRTLSRLLRHDPRPEAVVIECSGAAEPAAVVRTLMDPTVWRAAPLETVLCVLDAAAPPSEDPLVLSQLRAADLVALSRTDLADPAPARALCARTNPRAPALDAPHGRLPLSLLLPELPSAAPRPLPRVTPHADRFESLSWTHPGPLSLPRLQAAVARLSPRLVRAKGLFQAAGPDGPRSLLLQLAGGRAALSPAPPGTAPGARLVFIAELGALPEPELRAALEGCADAPPRASAP